MVDLDHKNPKALHAVEERENESECERDSKVMGRFVFVH